MPTFKDQTPQLTSPTTPLIPHHQPPDLVPSKPSNGTAIPPAGTAVPPPSVASSRTTPAPASVVSPRFEHAKLKGLDERDLLGDGAGSEGSTTEDYNTCTDNSRRTNTAGSGGGSGPGAGSGAGEGGATGKGIYKSTHAIRPTTKQVTGSKPILQRSKKKSVAQSQFVRRCRFLLLLLLFVDVFQWFLGEEHSIRVFHKQS